MSKKGRFSWNRCFTNNYNNDRSLDYIETIDFNNDIQITNLNDIDKIDLKKTSASEQVAKKLSKSIEI